MIAQGIALITRLCPFMFPIACQVNAVDEIENNALVW